ncbi:MAG: RNA polymerase sigma factor [Bryobacteraceae bacterium]|nr:RNA polymerase sigma factor [Bryobacteraceae bacterium]
MIFREADDRDLVLAARRGKVDAYNALITRWEKRIFNYLRRLSGHEEDAMDLAQDVFLKAWQSLGRLEDPARFGPWLYRIAHNEAVSHVRRKRPETDLENLPVPSRTARMAPVEVALAVEAALARLTPEQREAVILKVYEGLKFDEMAEVLSCPASTLKSRVYTALDELKRLLGPVVQRAGTVLEG